MKTFGIIILIIIGSFAVGFLTFNYIVIPLWVGLQEEATIPDICGKSLEEAKKILTESEFKSQVIAQKFSQLPQGLVLSQNPLPMRKVKKGRTVKLCVSKGEEKAKVPWVKGLLLTQGQNLLLTSGLEIGELEYQWDNIVGEDRIIRTEPMSDSLVPRGTKINIFVSRGREKRLLMPDFTGRSLKEVKKEANKLGLNLEINYTAEPSSLGIVIIQSPLPGTPVKRGDFLNLIVGEPELPR
ncbi:PASTA domain-containing protein [candidate division WOR-3 bacterium]|nr:PASTA domain-containing protein [candidate division WOR-3 bacterium]